MKKKGGWKKHHFWILFGIVPFLVFLCIIMFFASVDSAIAEESDKYTKNYSVLKSTTAQGKGTTAKLEEYQKTLDITEKTRWKSNYERQVKAKSFQWPTPANAPGAEALRRFEARHLKFGEELRATTDDEPFKFTRPTVYEKGYENLAESIAPTRFGMPTTLSAHGLAGGGIPSGAATGIPGGLPGGTAGGGWRSVLRHVSDWSRTPRPDTNMMWLALEDYWVQKALIEPIREMNNSITQLHLLTTDRSGKLVPYAGPANGQAEPPATERTFANRTWQIQLKVIESGSTRVLRAKLKNLTDRLQLLGLNKTLTLKVWFGDPDKDEPMYYKIEGELVKGHGELDVKLIPSQHTIPPSLRIEKITKVQQVLDELTVPVRLVQDVQLGVIDHKRASTALLPPEFMPADPNALPGAPTSGAPMGTAIPGDRDQLLMGGMNGKTGTPEQVLLANKNRYVVRTARVRRMPVGIVLVLDQAYIADALVAFANSPLRFQVTQVQWTRFRDPLPVTPPTPPVGTGVGDVDKIPTGVPMFTPMPMLTPGGSTIPGGSSLDSTNLTQESAGMIELGIFGLVSLYEKYDAAKDSDPGKTTTPTPNQTTPPTSTPPKSDPAPASPTPKTNTTPKPPPRADRRRRLFHKRVRPGQRSN